MAAPESVVMRSFAGGELSTAMAARADLARYTIAAKTVRNFIVHKHGGVSTRPGLRFIAECKTNDANVRLLRYEAANPGESVLIEMGESYLRFYFQDALVELDPGSAAAYNGGTAYVEGDIVSSGGALYYCRLATTGNAPPNATYWYLQSGDILEVPTIFDEPLDTKVTPSGQVLQFTAEGKNPYDLIFVDLTTWRMVKVVTTPQVTPPQSVVLSVPSGTRKFGYRVTAAHPETFEESEPSTQAINLSASDPTPANPHVISWASLLVDGVACTEYYIYCDDAGNGTYGFIGTATGSLSFRNIGITPDYSQTPPLAVNLFAGSAFPKVSGNHQQRRWFANFPGIADKITGSRVGFPSNFGISSPLQDDDAITARIAGGNHHPVEWIISLKRMLIMTGAGEWAQPPGILAPNSFSPEQETYLGCDPTVPPMVAGDNVIYVQARGSIVRDLRQEQVVEGLAGRDLTVFATHLFEGYTMDSAAYQITPDSIVWLVRNDGTLLGLTYVREQDVWGWHRHDTDGEFEYACSVPEPGQDSLYVIVRRTVFGQVKRYIEKLQPRTYLNYNSGAFFVDSGLTYSGAAVTSVSGLDHLEGETVTIFADGAHRGEATVSGGAVALGGSYSVVHVGLPYTSDLEPLNLDAAGTNIRDRKKRAQYVTLILDKSARQFQVGPDVDHLTRYTRPAYSPASDPFTGDVEITITANFNEHGRVFIRNDRPVPLTILGIVPGVELGG